jgi:hypothetical protein
MFKPTLRSYFGRTVYPGRFICHIFKSYFCDRSLAKRLALIWHEPFHWNATNHYLEVTWDHAKPTAISIFRWASLTRNDDFTIEFDLQLNDIVSGIEPGKTGGLEIGFDFSISLPQRTPVSCAVPSAALPALSNSIIFRRAILNSAG